MITARVHIGVDVGKYWLDVCYPDGEKVCQGFAEFFEVDFCAKLIRLL